MRIVFSGALALAGLVALAAPGAQARELATVIRLDAGHVELDREGAAPVSVWLSADTRLDASDSLVADKTKARKLEIVLPGSERRYVILKTAGGTTHVAAERALTLEQGSNFRDIGGYVTKDGMVVRWGKVFRSGAEPMLTPADLGLVDQLHIGTVVDLRSLEEREINPDTIDDREGALFVSNDYSIKVLMGPMMARKGEHIYEGMEKLLAPQYRSLYRRIMTAGEDGQGAVLYHCSAGQDRTGVATALLYDMLGVDRETILADYHLSTALRRPYWEMPRYDPADYPNNPIAQHYAKSYKDEDARAEPLYAPSGQSHLVQFFTYLDATYGGSAGYMKQVLGFSDADLARLREAMLRPAD
ncbi:tyrosine-protein phosphatase [Novosphingobium mangrovi (ex Huang et al. 2023)]|uniref:Tyrosine-protein phosphatase n=1 Tax=Novosphingobium mangrovi (ex Huang et al. 2023) TaxID=2976432 RepID=A0ABT2I242_9SPHN|nr:tyrosine-protein phosphatase [Novosphingobium mangrovi (ex Huang et al. 2023)]MCT2398873.1 tyrosine-protein phosphatase [Novosphingobium mangrovi (ex Huang et al. 2023)]